MSGQIVLVLLVLFGTTALFISDKFRLDLVGFMALTALLLGGVLTVPEALAGFADPTVHMIAGLFVVGGAVFHTGLADRFAQSLAKLGAGSPRKLLLTILLSASVLSAFLSSTGTVALMVPVVATLARRFQLSPSKLMIPLAYATLLGGMLTLIATPPNLIVSSALEQAGHRPFGFFEFTAPGLCLLAVGIGFLLLFSDGLLPVRVEAGQSNSRPSARDLWERYALSGWISEFEIGADSPLVGHSIATSQIRTRFSVTIFAVREANVRKRPDAKQRFEQISADTMLRAGQRIIVKGTPASVERFREDARLTLLGQLDELPQGLVAAEVLIPPGASLVGRSVADSRLRSRFDINVMAVFRSREVLRESVAQTIVCVGDLLLLLGTGAAVVKLRNELKDVILVAETEELKNAAFRREKSPHALVVISVMLAAMAFDWVAPVVAVICAALAMVLLRCIDVKSAEQAIRWETVLLIATILPLATALTKVGAIDFAAGRLVDGLGSLGPYAVMLAMFFVTALVGLFISNTATAVLVAPIALKVAVSLQVDPRAMLMMVAVASSSAFVTPISSPVNMLVLNAGGYRFFDFVKIGIPLLLLIALTSLLIVPFFFPFTD